MTGFALVLGLGALAGWIAAGGARPHARSYLRLGAVLYAGMAVAHGWGDPSLRDAISCIVMTIGPAVLALGAYAGCRRLPAILSASLILAAAALAGITSAFLALPVLAVVPQLLGAVALVVLARHGLFDLRRSGIYLTLAGLALLGAVACRFAPSSDAAFAEAGLLAFAAASVVGVALASNLFVEEERLDRQIPSVDGIN